MNKSMLAVALASVLVGGIAVAAYNSFTGSDRGAGAMLEAEPAMADSGIDAAVDGALPLDTGRIDFAEVVSVKPVAEKQQLYAAVIGTSPISETSTTNTPRQVCEDVVVHEQAPRKDPNNVSGTVAGAVVGGALGNQVGSGSGRKAATVAGAVGGAFAGRAIQQKSADNRVVERVDRQCRTVTDTSQSTRVTGYDVTYRAPDGSTGTKRMNSKPGERILLGNEDVVVGYDVTYSFEGQERTVRMDEEPGDRLPVVDGKVVTQTADAAEPASRG
ncbi:glycine zipper 2TM domain-containing protein [Marilutibacter alkalisoli]|uniref:Glycine zipper 2TM domain-containing protein n=1 Tax=Marilutibacter alkalisoli TaxID=2591633 RepID=A0A514BS26_9GAMM|nr:glycine zipper 2TM domain-containing protein [Lysobacter alkalisoli]QDH70202.1 glycine zipper 2TM domain-containing protein [Lysobacter alkalisoli]